MIKTVLFDLDGTLIDSRADLVAAVNTALIAVGRPKKTADQILPHVGNGLRVLLANVLEKNEAAVLDAATQAFEVYYDAHCVDQTVLYDGVLTYMNDFSTRTQLGVVTNKPRGFAEKILRELGVSKTISALFGGDSFPERKPHPRPILEAMKVLSAKPESTLIVGDGAPDILAGQAAGIKTCAARYGYGFLPELLDLKPDFVINAFNELKEIVK